MTIEMATERLGSADMQPVAHGSNGSNGHRPPLGNAGVGEEFALQLRRLLTLVERGDIAGVPPRDQRMLSYFSGYAAALEDAKRGRGAAVERAAAQTTRRSVRGAHSGRTPQIAAEVESTIIGLRREGVSIRAIAAYLNARDWPTVEGGSWQPSTIHSVLGRLQRCPEATG